MSKINFSCKKCGYCCKRGFVYLTKEEIKNIALFLKLNIKKFIEIYTENILWLGRVLKFEKNKCVFLNKNNLCLIYEARPLQCSKFPYWDWLIEKKNWQNEIKDYCNGIIPE